VVSERHGQVLKVRPEKLEEYKRLHAAVWPRVLQMIHQCNLRNYSIFHHDGFLFAYFEYVGEDLAADMAKMAADPVTQEWWQLTDPLQEPLATRPPGAWWTEMEEVFHADC